MKVLVGYSEENSTNRWVRADVEVSEEDLLALVAEIDIPEDALKLLTTAQKFNLLNSEAEICLLKQKILHGVLSREDGAARMASFKAMKATVLDFLKSTYVPF